MAVLGNIAALAFSSEYRTMVRTWQGEIGMTQPKTEAIAVKPTESEKSDMEKLSESLEKMAIGLDAISGSGNLSSTGALTSFQTGSVITPAVPEKREFAIPGVLLTKLMPDYVPKKIENKGIFDIHIFEGIEYTTYQDEKSKVKIFVFSEPYSVMRSNLKLVSGVYAINETDTFFEASFFLNPTSKKDTLVRFVTSLDGKAIGFEMSKAQYSKLKKILTKS